MTLAGPSLIEDWDISWQGLYRNNGKENGDYYGV